MPNEELTDQTVPVPPPDKTGWPWTGDRESVPNIPSGERAWPKVSVVTPSYNQERFLEKTIRSVLLQGYPNLEYIVIDGDSTDRSVSIIEKYNDWIDSWVSEPDRGQSHAINKGLQSATGDILTWLNSDDFFAPGAVHAMAQEFDRYDKSVGAIVGIGHKVDENGNITYTPRTPELTHEAFLDWMGRGNFMQPACFFRRRAWEECGPLREDLRYPMDVDLWLKIASTFKFKGLDKTIAYAHQHDDAKTAGERPWMRAELALLLAEHGGWREARSAVMKMADDLADARGKLEMIKSNPIYKYVVSPLRNIIEKFIDRLDT